MRSPERPVGQDKSAVIRNITFIGLFATLGLSGNADSPVLYPEHIAQSPPRLSSDYSDYSEILPKDDFSPAHVELSPTPIPRWNDIAFEKKFQLPEHVPSLALRSIWEEDHSWVSSLPPDQTRIIVATGDINLGRYINIQISRNGISWPLENTQEILRNADATIINLESALHEDCPIQEEGMVLCGAPANAQSLLSGGVDIVNLANNHIADYGQSGMERTIDVLRDGGLQPVENGSVVMRNIRGITFAFVGYNDIFQSHNVPMIPSDQDVIRQIQEIKEEADVVVVSYHFGEQYVYSPTYRQIHLAHLAVDAGADLVLGNHPHRVQPIEVYKGSLIVYSHGNFVFDQMWSEETRTGIIGRYTFFDDRLVDAQFIPVSIVDFGQPILPDTEQSSRILKQLEEISSEFAEQ